LSAQISVYSGPSQHRVDKDEFSDPVIRHECGNKVPLGTLPSVLLQDSMDSTQKLRTLAVLFILHSRLLDQTINLKIVSSQL
jgi:hypothetical protein